MELVDIIQQLKKRLFEYSQSQIYLLNDYSKAVVASINISISLAELQLYRKRVIEKNEKIWFDGGYQVLREFDDNLWRDISELYDELCKKILK